MKRDKRYSVSLYFDGPGASRVTKCPMCKACKKYKWEDADDGKLLQICLVKEVIPEDIWNMKAYQCDDFVPNPDSVMYDLVMKLIKESQEAKDGSQ